MPFSIHMGYPLKGENPPPPVGNLELMKVKVSEGRKVFTCLGLQVRHGCKAMA